jgi:hypothetical protein
MKHSDFIRDFMEKAPGPVVDRKAAAGLSGGLICSGALTNLDSKGPGRAIKTLNNGFLKKSPKNSRHPVPRNLPPK